MIKITLPSAGGLEEYGYVLAMALWLSFQCYLTGFVLVEYRRAKTYTKEYLDKHYLEEHKKAFPNDKGVPKMGYPDMGNGYYSTHLTYKQWFDFNIVQRIHGNFLEQILIVVLLLLIAGLRHTTYAVILGGIYSVSRILMAIGYMISVGYRRPGVILLNLSLGGLLFLSVDTLLKL